MKILLIQNHSSESFGHIETFLTRNDFNFDVFKAYENVTYPPLRNYSHIMIGGSPYSINDIHSIHFLEQEYRYIEKAIKLELPMFGLCFGAQLIANILGAQVQKNSLLEIGDSEICLTEAGISDPYFKDFPDKFHAFQWHGETFDIPKGAELLARGKFCSNQAYRYKNILAVQFHLEVDHFLISKWCNEFQDDLKNFHKNAEQIVQECLAIEKSQLQLCDLMLTNFLN